VQNSILSNRHRALLVAGDILVFLLFALLGRRAHSMGSAVNDIVGTAVPFILAWATVAPFTGIYSQRARGRPAQVASGVLLTWLVAYPLGQIIRIPVVGRVAHYSFVIVAGIATLLLLLGWRALFNYLQSSSPSSPSSPSS
jgi:hypothetical protein